MAGHRKLGRPTGHRNLMLRICYKFASRRSDSNDGNKSERNAKDCRKMITLAKRGDLHARRQGWPLYLTRPLKII